MVTKDNAKSAWQTIMMFAIMHSNQSTFDANSVGNAIKDAIVTLNDYFSEVESND